MSLVVLFPVGKEASADAYLSFCNAHNPDIGATWYLERFDRHGQRVVAYQGPGGFQWNGAPLPEPVGGETARADGVLSATVDWPIEEE